MSLNSETVLQEAKRSLDAAEAQLQDLAAQIKSVRHSGHSEAHAMALYMEAGKIYAHVTRYRALMDVYIRHG